MLTIGQLLVIAGPNPGQELSTNVLRSKFPARPLSLKSVIAGYEKQRLVLFVGLVSIKIFRSQNIQSMADLARASQSVDGKPDASQVLALSSTLRKQGLSLRLLDKDLQRAAIIGLAPALVNAPATAINEGNLLHVRDKFSGAEAIGGAVIGVGAVLIGAALAVTAPVWVLPVGAGLLGFGAGVTITSGILDILHDSTPAPRSDSLDSTPTPNDLGTDGPSNETIEIPNAVAVGSPPEGFNTDSVLQQLSDFSVDFSVDLVLSDLPVGFDPVTGAGLPGFPGGDGGDPGDPGDGGFPV
jgi:hypothetical protein